MLSPGIGGRFDSSNTVSPPPSGVKGRRCVCACEYLFSSLLFVLSHCFFSYVPGSSQRCVEFGRILIPRENVYHAHLFFLSFLSGVNVAVRDTLP